MSIKPQKFRFTVGVDAGTTTGIGIYDNELKRVTFAISTDFHGALAFIEKLDPAAHKIVVEIPGAFVYDRHNDREGKQRDKMNHHIGGNVQEAKLLAKGLEKAGFTVMRVPPVKEAKWSAAQLAMFTKYTAKTNQHVRDGIRLAFYHAGAIVK